MKQRNSFRPPVIGASSLLIIFAVLCLTMFTLLALSTAKANSRLSDASIRAVSNYYEADHQAEAIFSQLRDPSQPLPEGVSVEDSVFRYTVAISDTQILLVEVQNTNDTWTVLTWQAVSITDTAAAPETLN